MFKQKLWIVSQGKIFVARIREWVGLFLILLLLGKFQSGISEWPFKKIIFWKNVVVSLLFAENANSKFKLYFWFILKLSLQNILFKVFFTQIKLFVCSQPAIACSKVTIKTLKQGEKYVQN